MNADDAAFPVDQEEVNKLLGAITDVKSRRTLTGVQDFLSMASTSLRWKSPSVYSTAAGCL